MAGVDDSCRKNHAGMGWSRQSRNPCLSSSPADSPLLAPALRCVFPGTDESRGAQPDLCRLERLHPTEALLEVCPPPDTFAALPRVVGSCCKPSLRTGGGGMKGRGKSEEGGACPSVVVVFFLNRQLARYSSYSASGAAVLRAGRNRCEAP